MHNLRNHPDTVVLKFKDHITSEINQFVMNEIISALHLNTVCQALYIQNMSKSISDAQLHALIELFQKKMIWCLNIGENYQITAAGWERFCNLLPTTNITHLYVSEHIIKIELKNLMRAHIR